MSHSEAYIVQISQSRQERLLYLKREIFVAVNREWAEGARILFLKKAEDSKGLSNDVFIGSGTIERFISFNFLEDADRTICIANNWYGKIVCGIVIRFLPALPALEYPVPISVSKDTASRRSPLHTGMKLDSARVEAIEQAASVRIIS